ncbi:hypothetical protein QFC21_002030 [Naganishia friedmannii]|uniref:Uncharacterized protein n=1 Tax=Naganishia friedmannii TaxID=89922 RepID=A0ACC2VZX3_9TREE|nr:hypothetical protein QFC21_002030 [Naganishia friedmannii]
MAATITTALPGAQMTTSLFGEQPSPTTATQGRSSIDLFPTGPTGTSGAATTPTSSSGFSGVAVRAVYFRRRYRNSLDRATARGESPSNWATSGTAAEMYDYSWWRSWGMARYFGSNLDADDLDGFIPGDWRHTTRGRRRKNRKNYGEVPVLHETDLSEAHADDGSENGWERKQPLAIAVPHECLYDSLRAHSEGREPQSVEPGNRAVNQSSDYSAPILNYHDNREVTATAPRSGCDHTLQIRYLICMPESEAAIANRSQPDEYGEIVSHGPIEIGLWQPVLDMSADSYDDRNPIKDMDKSDIPHQTLG